MKTTEESALPQADIAYILKGYPRTSETFITHEIRLLEEMGIRLSIYSIKKLENQKNHGVVDKIRAPVTYLPQPSSLSEASFLGWLRENLPKFASSHGRLLKKRPLAYAKVLGETLLMSVKYRLGPFSGLRSVFIKEFLQAGFIADQVLEDGGIKHLHAHFCHGSTTIAMFCSGLSGIPFSFTAHAKDIYLKELNPGDLLQKKIRRAKFAVTCTGANKEHLDPIEPKGCGIHRIYHGLDLGLFDAAAPSSAPARQEDLPVILSVGRLVEKKGFDYLVRACAILRDRGMAFRCRIVGGADKYSERIVSLIAELGLGDVVTIHGAVTQEELREIYRSATMFVLPCLVVENGDRDGIPNVLVEAMAMEKAVISSDISGIPELVDHQVNGLLVPEKNPEALADAMAALLNDPELRERLARSARERVRRDFDSRHTTLELRDLFRACIANDVIHEHACCESPSGV